MAFINKPHSVRKSTRSLLQIIKTRQSSFQHRFSSYSSLAAKSNNTNISKHPPIDLPQIRNFSSSPTRRSGYHDLYKLSIENPEAFWRPISDELTWNKPWHTLCDFDISKGPSAKWFVGGETNMCHNAIDRHDPNAIAFITDSAVTGKVKKHTFGELRKQVSRLAAVYQSKGVRKGDTVVIYMPMIIEAVVAMLACARIGAIHSVVFGGFAATELSARIQHAEAKLLVTASGSKELTRTIDYLDIVSQVDCLPPTVLCYDRPGIGQTASDFGYACWQDEMDKAPTVTADVVWCESDHPLYILYTSGTTGAPKGVVRPQAGYQAALQWSFPAVFDIKNPSQVWFCAADIGWIVGHTYTVYGPMIAGTPSVLYEGKPVTPTEAHAPFFRLISEHNIEKAFVSPTAMRAVRNAATGQNDRDCAKMREKYPVGCFDGMFIAGEHCEVDTLKWSSEAFQCGTYDNWWQTEVGWPLTSPLLGIGDKFATTQPDGSTGLPVPGWDIEIIPAKDSHMSDEIAIKLPLPPGAFSTLWKADDRFRELYFTKYPGYYESMDAGKMDEQGFVSVMSRTDDVVNVAGHRISTGSIEECMCNERGVFEAAVVGKEDKIKGNVLVAFVISENTDVIHNALARVEKDIGRFSKISEFYRVQRLPKTRSGKTPRKTLKALVDGTELKIPGTIEDETVYDEIRAIIDM